MTLRAYLDNNATTALLPEALDAMRPYLTDRFLNPASAAFRAQGDVDPSDEARRALAAAFGDEGMARDFVLTSGASEANSWVVQAACPPGAHMVTSAIEHPSLLLAAQAATGRGIRLDSVGCAPDGRVSAEDVLEVLRPDTALVSIILANNETGALQPLKAIAAAVRCIAPGALIHTDATQAVGRVRVDLAEDLIDIDLLSLSAHKFHGPRGIGALFIRNGVDLAPMIHGQQDDGRRGGTANSAGAAGLAAAARHIDRSLDAMERVAALRDQLEASALTLWPGATVNGGAERLPNTASITFPRTLADQVVDQLAIQGVCIASGSACDSGATAPSHVLTAMGLSYDDAKATLRFSLSSQTDSNEIDLTLAALAAALGGDAVRWFSQRF